LDDRLTRLPLPLNGICTDSGSDREERRIVPDDWTAGAATLRTERLIISGFTLIRAVTLVQAAANLIIAWQRYQWPALALAALLVATAESALVVRAFRRQGSAQRGRVVAVDVACTVVVLAATGIAMKSSANPVTDEVLYPYSVASMVIVAFGIRRWPGVAATPVLVAGTYAGLAAWRYGFSFGLVANSLTYWAFALIGWALAGQQRRLSRELDTARADAVARARELADATHAHDVQRLELTALRAELDRERMNRQLHDNVLQTLEFMARDEIDPGRLRSQAAADAAWLRSLVQGGSPDASPGACLDATLTAVVRRHLAAGLRVQLNTAGIAQAPPLAAGPAEAVAGAVNEALTNVRKHAGTGAAVVRAAPSADGIVVTVLDNGAGFDAANAATGRGLPASIRARIREVGGTVVITSTPGAGTHVELRVPCKSVPPTPRTRVGR
jgi:signal transduction histidine kinase